MIVFGLDLWTEALWFQSVSFDSVFWTRFTAQLGLFLVATLGALAIVLINLAIAARLTEGTGDGSNAFRDLFERFGEAADPRRGGARSDAGAPRTVTFGPDEFPDLTPIARVVLIGLAVFVALTIGGSVAAAW